MAVAKVCEQCSATFEVIPSKGKTARFCSVGCYAKWQSENQRGEKAPGWRGGKIKTLCQQCGKEIETYPNQIKRGRGRFCSKKCKNLWQSEHNRGKEHPQWTSVEHTCETCGREFFVKPHRFKTGRGRFCSKKCRGIAHSRNMQGKDNPHWKGGDAQKVCEMCGATYTVIHARKDTALFCSRECLARWKSKYQSGQNSPIWRGGRKPYPTTFNRKFKRMIRQRDNSICAICGKKGKDVHHVDYNPQNTTPLNCIILCRSCHSKTNGNRQHWQEYLGDIMETKCLTQT